MNSGVVVIVCGGRNYANRGRVFSKLSQIHAKRQIAVVIEGGAPGADTLAWEWAAENGVHCAKVPAQWDRLGKGAGPARNAAMLLLKPDGVIAFPGGRGTDGMKAMAREIGVPVMEIEDGRS